ncbi:MAG: TonB family protein [Desulfovibrionaceae bacterium]|nr:TonB family protein [Desulfovibrionaceae bacterium]
MSRLPSFLLCCIALCCFCSYASAENGPVSEYTDVPPETDTLPQVPQNPNFPSASSGTPLPFPDMPTINDRRSGSLDISEGYGAQILERMLAFWQPPAGSQGHATALLRIGSTGSVLYCTVKQSSGDPALDESVCTAALRAKSFPAPEYGIISDVWITLSLPEKKAEKPAIPYAQQVMDALRPIVVVPASIRSPRTVGADLRIARNGSLISAEIAKSSGDLTADRAVLKACRTPGVLPAFDAPEASRLVQIQFTLSRQ